jgi:hypothetical protein
MKNIYAFYTSIQTANQNEEFACANWWKTSWEKMGWKSVMLNRSHAQGSHLYNKLASKMINASSSLPAERRNELDWLMARFSRWCALHAAGGGWMSDYDVFNVDFSPEKADEIEKKQSLYVCGEPTYLFYASRDMCSAAIMKFISAEIFNLSEKCMINSDDKDLLQKTVKHCQSTAKKKKSDVMQNLMS